MTVPDDPDWAFLSNDFTVDTWVKFAADSSDPIVLLASDTGCVLRHTYDEETGEARPFRSGYVNAECP